MAEQPDKDSRTEEATEQKRRDATEKGNVPFSREAGSLASFLGILAVIGSGMADGTVRLTSVLRQFLDDPGGWHLESSADAGHLFAFLGRDIFIVLAPPLLIMAVAGVAASLLQNPPQFVASRVLPDASRISISKGWSRIFGQQGLLEFAKSLFKFAAVGLIGVLVIRAAQFDMINALALEPNALPEAIRSVTAQMVAALLAALLGLGIADIFWSRFSWAKQLKMTQQEVKDEHKQSDGDPIQKGKFRSIARDRSRRRMMAAVPRATLVLVNPTHYAVALRYVRSEGAAPVVVAKGRDLIALRIREVAEAEGIPVVENKPLARSLYSAVEVDMLIPAEFYKAVAEIVLMILQRGTTKPTAILRPAR